MAHHIPYPTLFDFSHHISKIFVLGQNIQNPTKVVQFVILSLLNLESSHNIANSTIFAGRIEFLSDAGRGLTISLF